ncbi:hypothetical protein SAMN04488069_10678 [Hymenobacter psychrophilus]|uniref:Uncharacterized protein n=1 Tax=Hymenobacter psychrophilus TaxID=651662 RepID=A0A1H3HNV0_9BACT|nr:hypothetical protein SAMN04488069_10678 [Hymenobacter psychrophilus]
MRRWLLPFGLVLGLLAGCRSERVAFQFQPATTTSFTSKSSTPRDENPQTRRPVCLSSVSVAKPTEAPRPVVATPSVTSAAYKRPKYARVLKLLPRLLPTSLVLHPIMGARNRCSAAVRHVKQQSEPSTPLIEPSTLLIIAGAALLMFLIVKFPLVTLLVLGGLLTAGLVYLIIIFSGRGWPYG